MYHFVEQGLLDFVVVAELEDCLGERDDAVVCVFLGTSACAKGHFGAPLDLATGKERLEEQLIIVGEQVVDVGTFQVKLIGVEVFLPKFISLINHN